MICECGEKLICIDSRPLNRLRRRRYECEKCKKRYTTVEMFRLKNLRGKKMSTLKQFNYYIQDVKEQLIKQKSILDNAINTLKNHGVENV